MRARDSQRQKVFDAEDALVIRLPSVRLDCFSLVCDYAKAVTGTRWWKEHYSKKQVYMKQPRSDSCTSLALEDGGIRIAKCHYEKVTILHELCHLVIPWQYASHGREFCKTMLDMVGRFISPEAKQMLREEYRKHSVKWCAKKNISPAQRAAMAERARANFGLT